MNLSKKILLLSSLMICVSTTGFAKFEGEKYKPSATPEKKSEVSLKNLKLQSSEELLKRIEKSKENETILLEDGEYKELGVFTLNKKGLKLVAKNPGKVLFSGEVQIQVASNDIVIDGIVFKNGGPAERHGIIVITGSKNTVKNVVIDDFNGHKYTPNEKGEYVGYRWVTIQGKDNKIINNSFLNKTKRGTLMVVDIDDKPENHIIAQNIFYNHKAGLNGEMADKAMERINGNSWEVLRVGDSKTSLLPSETEILYNLFVEMDGETELVSIKSGENLIKGNTVKSSQSMISLRHGNDSVVEDNIVLGEGKEKTGGIRVYGENHIIRNNYIEDVRGYGDTRAGIALNTGVNDVLNNEPLSQSTKGKELNKQWTPKNTKIENNTVINSAQNILYSHKVHKVSLFDNSSVSVVFSAVNTEFKNNLSYTEGENNFALVGGGEGKNPVNSKYINETYYGNVKNVEDIKDLPEFKTEKPKLKKVNGLYISEDATVGAKNLLLLDESMIGPKYKIVE